MQDQIINYLNNALIHPMDKILDVGCGNKIISSSLKTRDIITLDIWPKTNPDILFDVTTGPLPFNDISFDVVLMLDFLEHLTKNEGHKVFEEAKRVCKRLVVIITPLWWDDNSEHVDNPEIWSYGNPWDYHKCLYSEDELINMGFRTISLLNISEEKLLYFGHWRNEA